MSESPEIHIAPSVHTETKETKRTEFFSREPEQINSYQSGDLINRENFVKFLIYSFAISRGDIAVQQIFFKWLSKVSESNVEDIIAQFGASGSIEALSKEEIRVFEDAFYAVSGHQKVYDKYDAEDIDDEIIDGLEQISNPSSSVEDVLKFYDLDAISTQSEFNECTRTYFQQTKGVLPKKG